MALYFPFAPLAWRPALIVLAALSDAFDGAFSRLFHGTSTFGQILDPIADKLFVASVLITLLVEESITVPQTALIAARDLAVLGGTLTVIIWKGPGSVRRLPPRWLGKLATAMQFLFLLDVVYHRDLRFWLFAVTSTMSVLAGVDYLLAPRPQTSVPRVGAPQPGTDATSDLQHSQGDRRTRPSV